MSTKPVINNYNEQCSLIDPNKPVRVYRNLHTGLWSVKQGVVRFHTNCIFLKNVTFPVNERVRLRVVENRRKEVHAFVMGTICEDASILIAGVGHEVTYSPYVCGNFMCRLGKVKSADLCCLIKGSKKMRVYASGIDTDEVRDIMTMTNVVETVETCLL